MTDKDQTIIFSMNGEYGLPDRLGAYEDSDAIEDRPTDFVPSLVSLGFIKTAIRRAALFLCIMAVGGLLVGIGVYKTSPHNYQASTSLLLEIAPGEDVNAAPANNQAMAVSRTVAGLAVHHLGLQENIGSFLSTYSAASVSDRVLVITLSAPSANQAVSWANAVARAFLQFRAQVLQTGDTAALESFDEQITNTSQNISSLSAQINHVSAQTPSSSRRSQLSILEAEQSLAESTLTKLQQTLINEQANVVPATVAAMKGSVVLDSATLLPHSRLKPLVRDAGFGLVAGLILGLGIVVVRALVSDRLRRRDDVAQALGAPVKLSVSTVRLNSRVLSRRWRSAVSEADVERIAAYLGHAIPGNSRRVDTLAVVPVDDLQVPALSLVSLAVSCAEQGERVVVADLCEGAPAAKLLGAVDPGVGTVNGSDTHLVVAVPEGDDMAPVGPFHHRRPQAQRSHFTEAVASACTSADLLLTLTSLDPALGGEHLSTWTTDAVAVVTAGRSSATKINAVGEMIRLSGVRLVSAVLVGADKTDESLGVVETSQADHDADLVGRRSHPDAHGLVAAPTNADYKRPHQT